MDGQPPPLRTKRGRRLDGPINSLSILAGVLIGLMMVVVSIGLVLRAVRTPARPTENDLEWGSETTTVTALNPTSNAGVPTYAPTPIVIGLLPTYALTANPTATAALMSASTESIPTAPSPPATAAGEADICPPPPGWKLHHVLPGETLFAYVLGAGGTVTTDDLRRANCLTSDLLQIGQPLYLPPGAAENAPSSDPAPQLGPAATGPRTPACDPPCTITIPPGWRVEQIAAAIDAIPVGFRGADFLAAVGPGASPPLYDVLATRPPGQSLEGYLYPGTYELSNQDTAESFRDMLLAAFAARIPPDADATAAAHGLTFYQIVTLASIIQRESGAYSEQVLISSVFHNRLRRGSPLGSTVTTQYALGGPGNWWPRVRGSQINTASPYNTNLNAGLPPSPIDSPGIEAINAALYPADTGYFYFTGNCRGAGNVYAATYEEHLANVNACN